MAWQPRPILVLKDALTAIGVAVLVIGAYRLMAALGELIAFSGAMGSMIDVSVALFGILGTEAKTSVRLRITFRAWSCQGM